MKSQKDVLVGLRIRETRETLRYSRQLLAEKADISESFLADIELGNKGLSAFTLSKLCRALCVSSDYILFGSNNDENYFNATIPLSRISKKYLPHISVLISAYVDSILLAEDD